MVEVRDKWVKVRVTMDSGAAGHVMPETMFPRVVSMSAKRHQRSLWPHMESKSKNVVEKTIPFKTNDGIQRCITFRSAKFCQLPSFHCKRSSEPETLWCWMKSSAHSKHSDGKVIKLDVSNDVYTMDMWICLDETGPVFEDAADESGFGEGRLWGRRGFTRQPENSKRAHLRDSEWSSRCRHACKAGSIVQRCDDRK